MQFQLGDRGQPVLFSPVFTHANGHSGAAVIGFALFSRGCERRRASPPQNFQQRPCGLPELRPSPYSLVYKTPWQQFPTEGNFASAPQGTFGNVWRLFLLPQFGVCVGTACWLLTGGSQGCG